jgi:acyl-lipid omega-6 desaturase (Delta-12 desaturase)
MIGRLLLMDRPDEFIALPSEQDHSDAALLVAELLSRDHRSLGKAMRVFAVHFALYLGSIAGAVAPPPIFLNVLFSFANGVFIALLFIIGHDAAHGSFVPVRSLNRWIARIAFIPCVHPASLWRLVHNTLHHGRTNLKWVDGVWVPMSTDEYRYARPLRRWLERVYRVRFHAHVLDRF